VAVAQVLAPLVAAPDEAAVVVDFDGTIAPIVDDPASARALPAAVEALRALTGLVAVVGVVSGRPLAFLRDRIGLAGVALRGLYGLEALVEGATVTDPRAAPFTPAVARAAAAAERRWPDLSVERKGDLAFTVHWRTTPAARPSEAALEDLATEHGLDLVGARQAAEFRVPVPTDKGSALTAILDAQPLRSGLFAGDDLGDLSAFDALARRPDFAGIKVAVASPEAPRALLEAADLVVDGPTGLARTLEALTAELSRRG
jgi:trehalose 6-phosphate phosphatase